MTNTIYTWLTLIDCLCKHDNRNEIELNFHLYYARMLTLFILISYVNIRRVFISEYSETNYTHIIFYKRFPVSRCYVALTLYPLSKKMTRLIRIYIVCSSAKCFSSTIRIANSIDPDQTGTFCAFWSGSMLFASMIVYASSMAR